MAATAHAFSSADRPPTLARACGAPARLEARSSWLTAPDGVRLYMIEAGTGATTIVLAHGGGSNLCETISYAKILVAAGFHVLAFDFRGWGNSESPTKNRLALGEDLAAAVARSRSEGAKHVFLIGSSMGGAAVVQNTSALDVDGRISLSGTRLWPGFGVNNPRGLARIRAPFLYLGTRDDWRAPRAEAIRIFGRVGARDKRMVIYAGSAHGWELVEGTSFARRARALILGWIRSRS